MKVYLYVLKFAFDILNDDILYYLIKKMDNYLFFNNNIIIIDHTSKEKAKVEHYC